MRRLASRRFSRTRVNAPPLCVGRFRVCGASRSIRSGGALVACLLVLSLVFCVRQAVLAQGEEAQSDNTVVSNSGDELEVEADDPSAPTPTPSTEESAPVASPTVAPTPTDAEPIATSTPIVTATPEVAATPAATATPATPEPQPAPPTMTRPFGRTVILVLGGVTWQQWLEMSAPGNPSTPGFRQLLEEGALSAAHLPAMRPIPGATISNTPEVSLPMLRVAAALSSGSNEMAAQQPNLLTALTLSTEEKMPALFPGWEDGTTALVYARRVGSRPSAEALLNLGAHLTGSQLVEQTPSDMLRAPGGLLGSLGQAVKDIKARTATFGNADTSSLPGRGALLREWALAAVDASGAIDGGDVSRSTLTSDADAPFGVRANRSALLARIDAELDSTRHAGAGLLSIEWGDTRRAALYEKYCLPEVAAKNREQALRQADAFLQALLPRLGDARDRLIVLSVPDLETPSAQWLPMIYWRPFREGQGALWFAPRREEAPGVIRLPDVTATVATRLNVGLNGVGRARGDAGEVLIESGVPQSAARRLARLLAFQAGTSRLEAARYSAQGMAALLLVLAALFTLLPAFGPANHSSSRHLLRGTRIAWQAAFVYPLLLWLAGLCIEITWRSGRFLPVTSPGTDWPLVFLLFGLALFLLLVLLSARGWFGGASVKSSLPRAKSQVYGSRIGVLWGFLTVLGLALGGFSLPWNAPLGALAAVTSTSVGSDVRAGDFWALLLISATMLGVSSMTRAGRATLNASSRRVINVRPAAIWLVLVWLLIWHSSWGRNGSAAIVAMVGFGALWLRLWSERAEATVRLRRRRWVLVGALALLILLLWPRGANAIFSLTDWWQSWRASWQIPLWNGAFAATLVSAALFLSPRRALLREYLKTRYSTRAMLGASAIAAVAALFIYGPAGPPLIALYTLGSVFYEAWSKIPEPKLLRRSYDATPEQQIGGANQYSPETAF